MDRKEFLQKSLKVGLGSSALVVLSGLNSPTAAAQNNQPDELTLEKKRREFVQNWLTDLLNTIDTQLDEETKAKLMAGCGRGCFNRHQWKQDIAKEGEGDVDKLVQALKKRFECWREGDKVHVRYGEVSSQCYCPAANYRPAKPNDMHCYCTRATHQAIWETALHRPVKVDIVETLRRGGVTCHFLVHLPS